VNPLSIHLSHHTQTIGPTKFLRWGILTKVVHPDLRDSFTDQEGTCIEGDMVVVKAGRQVLQKILGKNSLAVV
jgi:hypothetical protein